MYQTTAASLIFSLCIASISFLLNMGRTVSLHISHHLAAWHLFWCPCCGFVWDNSTKNFGLCFWNQLTETKTRWVAELQRGFRPLFAGRRRGVCCDWELRLLTLRSGHVYARVMCQLVPALIRWFLLLPLSPRVSWQVCGFVVWVCQRVQCFHLSHTWLSPAVESVPFVFIQ